MSGEVVYVALQQFCEADERPRQLLAEAGFELRFNTLGRRLRREEMATVLAGADAVLAGVEPYDAALLAALPRLRCISRCGAGIDSIDLEAAARRGVTVLTTPDEVAEPVAQLTVLMILALARNLPQHLHESRSGVWKKHTGFLLSEWTIGLVGFGRIGRAVERDLRTFSPRVIVADPRLVPSQVPDGVTLCSLDGLLSQADVVSLHAARASQDGPLIGRRELGLMRPGSRLVNTARGHLVDEAALLDVLQSGRLSAAALDVFEREPYQGPLAALPQVLCTPHVATLTRASRAAMEWHCAQNVIEYFAQPCARSPAAAETVG